MVEVDDGVSEAAHIHNPQNVAVYAKLHCAVYHEPWLERIAYGPKILRYGRCDDVGVRRTGELHCNSPLISQRIP